MRERAKEINISFETGRMIKRQEKRKIKKHRWKVEKERKRKDTRGAEEEMERKRGRKVDRQM